MSGPIQEAPCRLDNKINSDRLSEVTRGRLEDRRKRKKAAVRTVNHGQRPPDVLSELEQRCDVMPGPHTGSTGSSFDAENCSLGDTRTPCLRQSSFPGLCPNSDSPRNLSRSQRSARRLSRLATTPDAVAVLCRFEDIVKNFSNSPMGG